MARCLCCALHSLTHVSACRCSGKRCCLCCRCDLAGTLRQVLNTLSAFASTMDAHRLRHVELLAAFRPQVRCLSCFVHDSNSFIHHSEH